MTLVGVATSRGSEIAVAFLPHFYGGHIRWLIFNTGIGTWNFKMGFPGNIWDLELMAGQGVRADKRAISSQRDNRKGTEKEQ